MPSRHLGIKVLWMNHQLAPISNPSEVLRIVAMKTSYHALVAGHLFNWQSTQVLWDYLLPQLLIMLLRLRKCMMTMKIVARLGTSPLKPPGAQSRSVVKSPERRLTSWLTDFCPYLCRNLIQSLRLSFFVFTGNSLHLPNWRLPSYTGSTD